MIFLCASIPSYRGQESRYRKNRQPKILSESTESGVYIVCSKDGKQIFVTGHSEYDANTLRDEYFRDLNKGLEIEVPKIIF